MKFKVEYSVEKDMFPYLNAIWKMQFASLGRENLQERLLKKFPEKFKENIGKAETELEAKKVIKNFLDGRLRENKECFGESVKKLQKVFDSNETEITESLEAIYNKKFPFDEISVYLTTAGICPYNFGKRWFMLYQNADGERALRVAKHELNHFMFFYYYLPNLKKRGFNEHRLMVLKEALVVLDPNDTDKKPQAEELKKFLKTIARSPMDEIIEMSVQSEAFKNIPIE